MKKISIFILMNMLLLVATYANKTYASSYLLSHNTTISTPIEPIKINKNKTKKDKKLTKQEEYSPKASKRLNIEDIGSILLFILVPILALLFGIIYSQLAIIIASCIVIGITVILSIIYFCNNATAEESHDFLAFFIILLNLGFLITAIVCIIVGVLAGNLYLWVISLGIIITYAIAAALAIKLADL